jgi:hypothetical protein
LIKLWLASFSNDSMASRVHNFTKSLLQAVNKSAVTCQNSIDIQFRFSSFDTSYKILRLVNFLVHYAPPHSLGAPQKFEDNWDVPTESQPPIICLCPPTWLWTEPRVSMWGPLGGSGSVRQIRILWLHLAQWRREWEVHSPCSPKFPFLLPPSISLARVASAFPICPAWAHCKCQLQVTCLSHAQIDRHFVCVYLLPSQYVKF